MVYFLKEVDGVHIKIGTADDPYKRIGQLQTGNPRQLIIVATIDGDETKERELHRKFASQRIGQTEWFNLSQDDLDNLTKGNDDEYKNSSPFAGDSPFDIRQVFGGQQNTITSKGEVIPRPQSGFDYPCDKPVQPPLR